MAETTPLQRHPVRDWTARTRSSFLDAQRYSRFVTIMKRALPIAAFALIAAIVAYSLQPRQQNRVEMTFESVNQIAITLLRTRDQRKELIDLLAVGAGRDGALFDAPNQAAQFGKFLGLHPSVKSEQRNQNDEADRKRF